MIGCLLPEYDGPKWKSSEELLDIPGKGDSSQVTADRSVKAG